MDRPFIPVSAPMLAGNEKAYVMECLDSTWISSSGRFLEDFQKEFARFCGVEHAIAVNNGTTALHLALVALGVGPGDEVIVPTLTYIASANAVRYCNATPVLVDCEPGTLNLDVEALRAKITPRTKGVMPVHLYGHPADMDPILALAQEHGLFVLEDAAEAHGARYKGRPVGSIGHCATFSFYGNKIVTTGEGGMVTTNDAALAERLRLYRGQGVDPHRRYRHPVVGFNYRMTNVAAAIGLAQLERVEDALDKRRLIAGWYAERLEPLKDRLTVLTALPWAEPVPWLVTVMLRQGGEPERDAVMAHLLETGVDTRPLFYPMHVQPPYAEDSANYPVASRLAGRGISLPTFEALSEAGVRRVCEALVDALGAQT